jgi:hypothetical protein
MADRQRLRRHLLAVPAERAAARADRDRLALGSRAKVGAEDAGLGATARCPLRSDINLLPRLLGQREAGLAASLPSTTTCSVEAAPLRNSLSIGHPEKGSPPAFAITSVRS